MEMTEMDGNNGLMIFSNTDFGEIRTTAIDNEPWFVGKDVAVALGYTNPRKAMADHVDEEDKGVTKCDTLGGTQQMTIINESGLYSLILSSKLESAKRFKRWITSEVLPSIRKHGGSEQGEQTAVIDRQKDENVANIEVYRSEQFGEIRTLEENGKALFCASDVAKALGYSNPRDAISRHCRGVVKRDGVSKTTNQYGVTTNQPVEMSFIPEGDVYRLIAHSKLPGAERFESWVFDDVIPSIRKHGMYAADELLANPDLAISAFTALKEEREKRLALEKTTAEQAKQLKEMQPKAAYCDVVLACKDLVSVNTIAKDYGKTAVWLNKWLHEHGVQYK